MQNETTLLKRYMKRNGLSQSALAEAAGVSQATISRALRGNAGKFSAARERLFTYAEITKTRHAVDAKQGPHEKIIAAFEEVWDNTDSHAEGIATVIQALGSFGRKKREVIK